MLNSKKVLSIAMLCGVLAVSSHASNPVDEKDASINVQCIAAEATPKTTAEIEAFIAAVNATIKEMHENDATATKPSK